MDVHPCAKYIRIVCLKKTTTDDFSIITIAKYIADLRERPFNLKGEGGVKVFCFVQNFFFGQHKSWNIDFFLLRKARNFFPEF